MNLIGLRYHPGRFLILWFNEKLISNFSSQRDYFLFFCFFRINNVIGTPTKNVANINEPHILPKYSGVTIWLPMKRTPKIKLRQI